jgi:erythrocyte band 7 integral membrane protein
MTKDNVSLHLTSVIYYRITSPHKAAFGIANVRQALIERTQTTLRHVIGARVLQDVIERREEIAQSIREIIEETAAGWGVEVESMLIKDIIFSQDLQDSLSMAAQSKRTGEAKVIAARAEVESAKLMRVRLPVYELHVEHTLTFCVRFYRLLQTSSAPRPLCKSDTSRLCKLWLSRRTQR